MPEMSDAVPGNPRMLTIGEVVSQTRLSASTVRRIIRRRELAVHRFGRLVRISEADLHAFLAKRRRAVR